MNLNGGKSTAVRRLHDMLRYFFYRITYAVIECNASRSHYYTDVMHGYVVHIRLIVGLADGFRE